jgi:hypothetical protein
MRKKTRIEEDAPSTRVASNTNASAYASSYTGKYGHNRQSEDL